MVGRKVISIHYWTKETSQYVSCALAPSHQVSYLFTHKYDYERHQFSIYIYIWPAAAVGKP